MLAARAYRHPWWRWWRLCRCSPAPRPPPRSGPASVHRPLDRCYSGERMEIIIRYRTWLPHVPQGLLVNTVRFTVKHQHYRHAYDADTCTNNGAPAVIEMQSKTTTLQLLHVHVHVHTHVLVHVHSIAESFCFTLEFWTIWHDGSAAVSTHNVPLFGIERIIGQRFRLGVVPVSCQLVLWRHRKAANLLVASF